MSSPHTIPLDEAQTRAVIRATRPESSNVFIAWWKMGTGKTRLSLAMFEVSGFQYCIVVCRRIAFQTWINEMEECGLDYRVYANDFQEKSILRHSKSKGIPKTILFLSTSNLGKRPTLPNGEMLIVDELYLFANPKSKRSRELQKISLFCSARVGLSGTIMPAQDNMSIFGQLKALHAHQRLANTTTEFRSKFQDRFRTNFGCKFKNSESSYEKIIEEIKGLVDINFPTTRPTRIQTITVDKTPEQTKAIKELKELYEYKNIEYNFAIQVCNVINGISNGWWVNPENGDMEFRKSDKIDQLYALLDELCLETRVVVWCSTHADIKRIAKDIQHPWLEFTARIPFDSARWLQGKTKIVLATEANGSSVNWFKDVKYAIYFSIDYKAINLQQSMGRHERKGSKHDGAHYYFLQTRGTLDAHVYRLVQKSDLAEKQLILELAKNIETL